MKHQHRPDTGVGGGIPLEQTFPGGADGGRVQHPVLGKPGLRKKVLSPPPERPPEPVADGQAEPLLGPLRKFRRHITPQHLAQKPLSLVAPDPLVHGEPPGEIEEPVIEKRVAGLQTESHAGAVKLGQDVVGEVGDAVQIHHALDGIALPFLVPDR